MQVSWLSTTEGLYCGLAEDSGIFPSSVCNISLVQIISWFYSFTFSVGQSLFKASFMYKNLTLYLPWESREFIVPTAFQCLQHLPMDSLSATIHHRILLLYDFTEHFSRVMVSGFSPYWSIWTENLMVIHNHISIFLFPK